MNIEATLGIRMKTQQEKTGLLERPKGHEFIWSGRWLTIARLSEKEV